MKLCGCHVRTILDVIISVIFEMTANIKTSQNKFYSENRTYLM